MYGKDCCNRTTVGAREGTRRCRALAPAIGAMVLLLCAGAVRANEVRIWRTAVATGPSVVIGDVCDFSAYRLDDRAALSAAELVPSPEPGASLVVDRSDVSQALRRAGANLATLTLSGSVRCTVSRPEALRLPEPKVGPASGTVEKAGAVQTDRPGQPVGASRPMSQGADSAPVPASSPVTAAGVITLREQIETYFGDELATYGGRAQVAFNDSAQEILELTSPPYHFHLRHRTSAPIGLTSVDVELESADGTRRSTSVPAQVSMIRDVVVARRAINLGATVSGADVALKAMAFTRLDRTGLGGLETVIGQRARRFVQPGTLVTQAMLEPLPLVVRGQFVRLESVAGDVRIVTSGMAADDGMLGEVVRVRSSSDRRIEIDGVVVGPGRVRVGGMMPSKVVRASRREVK